MGRSRGGLTTKIHALVDAEGRPVRLTLTAGQAMPGDRVWAVAHDGSSADGSQFEPSDTLTPCVCWRRVSSSFWRTI